MKKNEVFAYIAMLACLLGLCVLILAMIVPISARTQALMSCSSLVIAIIMGLSKYRLASKKGTM